MLTASVGWCSCWIIITSRNGTAKTDGLQQPQALLWPVKPSEANAALLRQCSATAKHSARTYATNVRTMCQCSAHECSRAYSHTTGGGRPTVKATAYADRIMNGLAAQMLSAAVQQSAAARPTSERATILPRWRVHCAAAKGRLSTLTNLNGAEAARTISASLGG